MSKSISQPNQDGVHSVQWATATYSGSRKTRNDDSLISFASDVKGATSLEVAGNHSLRNHDLVFAVSDGMGGGNAGDLASSTLLEKLQEIIPETFKIAASGFFPDALGHLAEAIQDTHHHVNLVASQSEEAKGMAATLAMVWITPENIYVANVGDSRVYRSRGGQLEQLSRDHTTVWGQWKRGEITEIQYRQHPRRAALYEVIGGAHTNVNPYFAAIPYQTGDRFLICSDGVVDGLWERHISDALAAQNLSLEEISEKLLKRSIDNSGVDDNTLIVLEMNMPT